VGVFLHGLDSLSPLQTPYQFVAAIGASRKDSLVMGRPRLTPEERERRRKERSRFTFSDAAYQHYDTAAGFGSPDEWEKVAELLFGLKKPIAGALGRYLAALGLDALPDSIGALTKAFRTAMFQNHPDHGGTNQAARDTLEAYAFLK